MFFLLIKQPKLINNPTAIIKNIYLNSWPRSNELKIKLKNIQDLKQHDTKSLALFFNLLNKLVLETNKKDSTFIFVYKPSREFYDKNVNIKLNRSKFNSELKPEIINFLEKQNINYIDLNKELRKRKIDILDLYPFRIRSHFNKEGQELVAEIINEYINQL